jgi:hypothetical protein
MEQKLEMEDLVEKKKKKQEHIHTNKHHQLNARDEERI